MNFHAVDLCSLSLHKHSRIDSRNGLFKITNSLLNITVCWYIVISTAARLGDTMCSEFANNNGYH